MKTALIIGACGQDGSFMAEHLLSIGYRVIGTTRKAPDLIDWMQPMLGKAEFVYADVCDTMSIEAAVNKAWPDEVYNFAAYDSIPLCWQYPEQAMDVIYGGLSRLLSILRRLKPDARIYHASSAAIFGQASGPCEEDTPKNPDSPYAIAKAAAQSLAEIWRDRGQWIACGICMNHESPRRFNDRASLKIAKAVAGWALGSDEPLVFGSQDAKRDWGYAGDFVKAFHLMLQQDAPEDYVIGSGEARTVRDFIKACCTAGGLGAVPDHMIKTDQQFIRKGEAHILVANPSKVNNELGWKAETDMQHLAEIMVNTEMERARRRIHAENQRTVPA